MSTNNFIQPELAVVYHCRKCGDVSDTYIYESIDTENDDVEYYRLCSKCNGDVTETNQLKEVEQFAIVELFGHQVIAGKVSEQVIGGQGFIRVDVPTTESQEGFTKALFDLMLFISNEKQMQT